MSQRNNQVESYLRQANLKLKTVEFLPGDASNRSYGRLTLDDGSTQMMMFMNAAEAFKSEEAVATGFKTAVKELPFVVVGKTFEKAGVRVPHIHFIDPDHRYLVLEDFGSEILYDRRQKEPAFHWYEKAMDELIRIQAINPFPPASEQRFSKELLQWECEHFFEYALEKRNKVVSQQEAATLKDFFEIIVRKMTESESILVHRDFHSKNLHLLTKEDRLGVIDFQDALTGPTTYDLASLLRDSYVRLSQTEEDHLLKYYEKKSGRDIDRELFGLTSLQRNLKAVGRFYYISIVKGRDTHLPYVAPTLSRIFQTLYDLRRNDIEEILRRVMRGDY